jgi:hypothetical protein
MLHVLPTRTSLEGEGHNSLSCNVSGQTRVNHKELHSGWPVIGGETQMGYLTFRIQIQSVTATPTRSVSVLTN